MLKTSEARSAGVRSQAPGFVARQPTRRGEVYIWSSPDRGRSWNVEHLSASVDSSALLANTFTLDEAVRIVRETAHRLGAIFDEGDTPFGGSAA